MYGCELVILVRCMQRQTDHGIIVACTIGGFSRTGRGPDNFVVRGDDLNHGHTERGPRSSQGPRSEHYRHYGLHLLPTYSRTERL